MPIYLMSPIIKHIGIIPYLQNKLFNTPKPKIPLSNFTLQKLDEQETNEYRIRDDQTAYHLHDNKINNNKKIGYFQYKPANGQLGIIRLDAEYRGYSIFNQVLNEVIIDDMESNGVEHVFAVTTYEHPYFSKIPNIEWKDPAGLNVTGSGYSISMSNIKSFLTEQVKT
jgi:hypothetical protein